MILFQALLYGLVQDKSVLIKTSQRNRTNRIYKWSYICIYSWPWTAQIWTMQVHWCTDCFCLFVCFKILFIYSWETQRKRGRDTGRGRSRLHAGSPMCDSIPGLQDHTLGQRQAPNCWVTQGSPGSVESLYCTPETNISLHLYLWGKSPAVQLVLHSLNGCSLLCINDL